jgi:hypothetical protein
MVPTSTFLMSAKPTERRTPRPIRWWFTRGGLSLLTIPIFFILLAGTLLAFAHGFYQTYAYLKVTNAVWGWLGFVAFFFIWPFSLLMPGWFWWAAIKETPTIYLQGLANSRRWAVGQFILTIVLLIALSTFVQWGHGKIIGWIADRNPDAAYRAGVTGSIPPSSAAPSPTTPEATATP